MPPSSATKLSEQLASLRLSSGFVLAAFLFNAGVVVLLIAAITKSVPAALITLLLMAGIVVALALYAETFLLGRTGARQLAPGEFPWVKPMVAELALGARISMPEVLISDQETPNAFTTGTAQRSKIVFFTGLLDRLPRDEVRAVAAHELAHVVNRDVSLGVWSWALSLWVLTVGAVVTALAILIVDFSRRLPEELGGEGPLGAVIGLVGTALGLALAASLWVSIQGWALLSRLGALAFSRERESLADMTAAAITRQPHALADALATIHEFPVQDIRGGDAVARFCIVTPRSGRRFWDDLLSTHPSPERRIEALRRLSLEDLPEIDEKWEGVSTLSWWAPAASAGALILLALCIPACV